MKQYNFRKGLTVKEFFIYLLTSISLLAIFSLASGYVQ